MTKKSAKPKRHTDPNLAAHDVLARLTGEKPKRPPAKPKGAKRASTRR
jgi:hypothetical protein